MSSLLPKKNEEFVKLIFCSSNSLLYRGWEVGGVSHEIILDKTVNNKDNWYYKERKKKNTRLHCFQKKIFLFKTNILYI